MEKILNLRFKIFMYECIVEMNLKKKKKKNFEKMDDKQGLRKNKRMGILISSTSMNYDICLEYK